MESKKIPHLVVDTSAFLYNAPIQELGECVITCEEVVNEVTDKRHIRRLVVLPYDLQIKHVFPENIKFEFSKKTGDYRSLSATDIKVIALTYQLEKEKVGSGHLRSTPEFQRTINFQNRPEIEVKDMVGFYVPSKKDNSHQEVSQCSADVAESAANELASKLSVMHCSESDKNENFSIKLPLLERGPSDEKHADVTADDVDPSSILVEVKNFPDDTSLNELSEQSEDKNPLESGDSYTDDDDDDEVGWITPSNVKEMKSKINANFEEEKAVTVACLTTDFAMQNVLKQIGLHVSSVEGRIIKQMRTFILRCYACFKTTSILTKVFCPHCGHKTLKRVAVSLEPDGSQKIHINLKKPLSTKGKRVSLPTFKGGKHSNNPIIFADQPVPHQRPSRLARIKTNILEGDYIPGFSPFALRDTTSKSAMLGIRPREMKHGLRNEPIVGRKRK